MPDARSSPRLSHLRGGARLRRSLVVQITQPRRAALVRAVFKVGYQCSLCCVLAHLPLVTPCPPSARYALPPICPLRPAPHLPLVTPCPSSARYALPPSTPYALPPICRYALPPSPVTPCPICPSPEFLPLSVSPSAPCCSKAFSGVALWLRVDHSLEAEAAEIAEVNAKEKALHLLAQRALRTAKLRRAADHAMRASRLAGSWAALRLAVDAAASRARQTALARSSFRRSLAMKVFSAWVRMRRRRSSVRQVTDGGAKHKAGGKLWSTALKAFSASKQLRRSEERTSSPSLPPPLSETNSALRPAQPVQLPRLPSFASTVGCALINCILRGRLGRHSAVNSIICKRLSEDITNR